MDHRLTDRSPSGHLAVVGSSAATSVDVPRSQPRVERLFEDVYQGHFAFVWNCLVRHGVGWSELEDAAHDVFVVVYRRLPEFEGNVEGMRAWLFVIARGVAQNRARARRRRLRLVDQLANEPAATCMDIERAAEWRRKAALLQQFVAQLDHQKRRVFVAMDIERKTAPEVARELGLNVNTVYSRRRAAQAAFEQWARQGEVTPPSGARDRVLTLLAPSLLNPSVGTLGGSAAGAVADSVGSTTLGWAAGLGKPIATLVAASVLAVTVVADRSTSDERPSRPAVAVAHAPSPENDAAAPPSSESESLQMTALASPPDNDQLEHAQTARAPANKPTRATTPKPAISTARTHTPHQRVHAPTSSSDEHSRMTTALAQQNDRLRRARAAWEAGQWSEATKLARRYDDEFPGGLYAQEMLAIDLSAQCRLGTPDTRLGSQVSRFLAGPSSRAQRRRVAQACGAHHQKAE